jgi:LuxR family maltose regulon positive regulatory protein
MQAAERWAHSQVRPGDPQPELPVGGFAGYVLSRIEFSQGQTEAPLARSIRLAEDARESGDLAGQVRACALQALILDAQRRDSRALESLETALSAAEPGGFVRAFLELDPALEPLLVRAVAAGKSADYARRLLEAFQEGRSVAAERLVEPLSARELQVLRLLPTHLTRVRIAEELVISENTVRTHLKNIYQKLGVHTRADAIACAADLGILRTIVRR